MSIRIRKSKTKNGPGRLFVYRSEYQRATTTSGVRVPGHVRDIYTATLRRFTVAGQSVKALVYHVPKAGQPPPAKLTEKELATLDAFLVGDAKNYKECWPKALVAEIRADVRSELEREAMLTSNARHQDNIDVAASVMRGAAMDVVARAAQYRATGQALADGWLREKNRTNALGESDLTQLKGMANDIRQAAAEFDAALKAAQLIQAKPKAMAKEAK